MFSMPRSMLLGFSDSMLLGFSEWIGAVLLAHGYAGIRRGKIAVHKRFGRWGITTTVAEGR
jgi:hypothetical protein